jgi:ferritin
MNSISTIFNNNNKIIDYVEEEDESVSQKDIAKVDLELIRELEELYEDNEEEEELI